MGKVQCCRTRSRSHVILPSFPDENYLPFPRDSKCIELQRKFTSKFTLSNPLAIGQACPLTPLIHGILPIEAHWQTLLTGKQ